MFIVSKDSAHGWLASKQERRDTVAQSCLGHGGQEAEQKKNPRKERAKYQICLHGQASLPTKTYKEVCVNDPLGGSQANTADN